MRTTGSPTPCACLSAVARLRIVPLTAVTVAVSWFDALPIFRTSPGAKPPPTAIVTSSAPIAVPAPPTVVSNGFGLTASTGTTVQ